MPIEIDRHEVQRLVAAQVGFRLAGISDHPVPFGLRARPAAGQLAPPRAEPLAASRLRLELHVLPHVDQRPTLRAPATVAAPIA